jgi:hypothetical protein
MWPGVRREVDECRTKEEKANDMGLYAVTTVGKPDTSRLTVLSVRETRRAKGMAGHSRTTGGLEMVTR